jgi:hypothetical protein
MVAPSETKEATNSRLRAMDVGALTSLGTFVRTRLEEKRVVHLDRLTPYQGAFWEEQPYGGSNGSTWRVITVRTEPRGRKKIPIMCITNRALGKLETGVQREQFSKLTHCWAMTMR